MTALDTDVLVRFLVRDDAAQTQKSAALIEAASAAKERLYVSDVVLCEVVWVLSAAYDFGRSSIASVLLDLTRARQLQFESSDRIARCVRAFQTGKGDFADYMIREHGRQAGCADVATFDRVLLKEAGFVAP